MLDPQLKVVLEVFAHALKLVKHLDAERLEHIPTSNPGHLEQRRRVVCACGEHDFALRLDLMHPSFGVFVLNADRSFPVQQHAPCRGVQSDGEVGPRADLRAEKGVSRTPAAAVLHGDLHVANAALRFAVDVVQTPNADALRGIHVRFADRVLHRDVGDVQLAVVAVIGVVRFDFEMLGSLEVGEKLIVGPALAARKRGPIVVILTLAARVDHPVDRAAASDDAPANNAHLTAIELGLWLGLVEVADFLVVHELGEADGHLDERILVVSARLQEEHPVTGIGR